MKEITSKKIIHSILYDLLCYFDDFCKENELKYFISNGTVLGAAKYKDFIPWEDDVDVLMPRAEYDKLMKLTSINNEPFRLLCIEQIKEWRMPYAKLIRSDTYVEEGKHHFGINVGLAIDIFPIDNWASSKICATIQSLKCEILKRKLVFSICDEFKTRQKGIKKLINYYLYKSGKRLGHRKIQNKILRFAEKTKKYKTKYCGCVVWTSHLNKEILNYDCFKDTVYLNIRNRSFPTMQGYEVYLKQLYGNYKKDLPIDKQHSNHEIKVWWTNA